jgi:hypothetical protein
MVTVLVTHGADLTLDVEWIAYGSNPQTGLPYARRSADQLWSDYPIDDERCEWRDDFGKGYLELQKRAEKPFQDGCVQSPFTVSANAILHHVRELLLQEGRGQEVESLQLPSIREDQKVDSVLRRVEQKIKAEEERLGMKPPPYDTEP